MGDPTLPPPLSLPIVLDGYGERSVAPNAEASRAMLHWRTRQLHFGARSADDLARAIRSRVRRIFMLIDKFFLLAKIVPDRDRLQDIVGDLIERARDCFVLAAISTCRRAPMSAAHQHCLGELEGFQQALRDRQPMSALEIQHAMDSLVVYCIELDAAPRGAVDPAAVPE